MITRRVEIDKGINESITFILGTTLDDIYANEEVLKYFNEMMRPDIKVSTCLSLMANMFALIEKTNEGGSHEEKEPTKKGG